MSVDKHRISSSADLRNRVGLAPVGSDIEIDYMRDGVHKSVTLRIEAGGAVEEAEVLPNRLEGAEFRDAGGTVVVKHIEEGSAAAQSGLKSGDVIVAVNRRPISSVADLTEALRDAKGTLAFDLVRGGTKLFLIIR